MRLFTAIDIPPDVRAALAALLERLRPLADLRWIPLEKLHITTKFIGEWPEERLDELKRALALVKAPAPVNIVIRGLGRHPESYTREWSQTQGSRHWRRRRKRPSDGLLKKE